MLMRTDPFRELDRLTQQVFGGRQGTWSRPAEQAKPRKIEITAGAGHQLTG